MGITSLTYEPPVRRSERRERLDYGLLEAAVTAFDEGRHAESLAKTFEHLFPGATPPRLEAAPFSFAQGSSRVTAYLEGGDVVIAVPLARLPPGGKAVAALRYVLTKISCPGQLYQPRLRGDDLWLEFRDSLDRAHPSKIVEVLRRMPVEADNNDDWLIGQFGALPLDRADIAPLDDAEFARAEVLWRRHWADVEELVKECQRKGSVFFLNEVTAYALYLVRFALPLGGHVGTRLAESAAVFNDNQQDAHKREAALSKCARDMKAVPADELKKSLGHASYAISPLGDGTPKVLSGYLGAGNYRDSIEQFKRSGKSSEAALALVGTYTYLLACFAWPEAVESALKEGLAKASGEPWQRAANLLFDHARGVVDAFAGDDGEGAGGGAEGPAAGGEGGEGGDDDGGEDGGE